MHVASQSSSPDRPEPKSLGLGTKVLLTMSMSRNFGGLGARQPGARPLRRFPTRREELEICCIFL